MQVNVAHDLGQVNRASNGTQRLYQLVPPMGATELGDVVTYDYVVVSAVNAFGTGDETYIFPADASGEITDWLELDGSFKGDQDHEEALRRAGYTVVVNELGGRP